MIKFEGRKYILENNLTEKFSDGTIKCYFKNNETTSNTLLDLEAISNLDLEAISKTLIKTKDGSATEGKEYFTITEVSAEGAEEDLSSYYEEIRTGCFSITKDSTRNPDKTYYTITRVEQFNDENINSYYEAKTIVTTDDIVNLTNQYIIVRDREDGTYEIITDDFSKSSDPELSFHLILVPYSENPVSINKLGLMISSNEIVILSEVNFPEYTLATSKRALFHYYLYF